MRREEGKWGAGRVNGKEEGKKREFLDGTYFTRYFFHCSSFANSKLLYNHAVSAHAPTDQLFTSCQWEGCSNVRRSRASLLFHLRVSRFIGNVFCITTASGAQSLELKNKLLKGCFALKLRWVKIQSVGSFGTFCLITEIQSFLGKDIFTI